MYLRSKLLSCSRKEDAGTSLNALTPSQFQGFCLGHCGTHNPLSKSTRAPSTNSSFSLQHSPPSLLNISCLHFYLLTRSHLEKWGVKTTFNLPGLQLFLLCSSSHPCSEKSAGESLSSFPWPQPEGKTPLPLPQPSHWTSHNSPTSISSLLFLHCFHMLPYPLNLVQLGRVEISSPRTPGPTIIIAHTNTFSARLVCLLFYSFLVSISTASEDLYSGACVSDQTVPMLQHYVEKTSEEKRAMVETLIVTVQNYFSLPNNFFFFSQMFIYAIILLFHPLIACFFHVKFSNPL